MATYEATGYREESWDYRVYLDGATYFAQLGNTDSGLSVLQNANGITLLQATIDALPITGGTIFLDMEGVNFLGTITINKPRIRITTYQSVLNNTYGADGVVVRTITLDSSTREIHDCVFTGLTIRQVNYNADTNPIRYNKWVDCQFNTSTSGASRGLMINSVNGGYVDHERYYNCLFRCANTTASEGGLMTVSGTGANSTFRFVGCKVIITATGVRMIHFADGGYMSRLKFIACEIDCDNAGFSYEYVHIEAQTAANCGGGVYFEHCVMECGGTLLMFSVEASAQNVHAHFILHGNRVDDWVALTLINNLNVNWTATAATNGLDIADNRFVDAAAVTPGTTGAHANFIVEIHENPGYNPVGNIATPYPAGAGFLLDSAAANAFPTSAADYTVAESPKQIVIGGGTITSVNIDGVATGQAGAATVTRSYYLKPGQVWNVVWTIQPTINGVWAQ